MRARFTTSFYSRLLVGAFGLAMLVALLALAICAPTAQAATAGQQAYNFQGTIVGGQEVSLASYAGKPLILILWASW